MCSSKIIDLQNRTIFKNIFLQLDDQDWCEKFLSYMLNFSIKCIYNWFCHSTTKSLMQCNLIYIICSYSTSNTYQLCAILYFLYNISTQNSKINLHKNEDKKLSAVCCNIYQCDYFQILSVRHLKYVGRVRFCHQVKEQKFKYEHQMNRGVITEQCREYEIKSIKWAVLNTKLKGLLFAVTT